MYDADCVDTGVTQEELTVQKGGLTLLEGTDE
jgi:hypothetical protein